MNSFATEAQARMEIQALTRRGKALIAHGLTGVDLVKCWIRWSIQPLAIRPRLIFEYTGKATDTLRFSEAPMLEDQVVKSAKPLLGEKLDKIALNGLAPFYTLHQAPPMVTSKLSLCISCNFCIHVTLHDFIIPFFVPTGRSMVECRVPQHLLRFF